MRARTDKKVDNADETEAAAQFLPAALSWLRLLLERQSDLEESGKERREAQIACACAEMAATQCADPPPPLVHLGAALGLSPFERNILLLCCGLEMDTRIAPLCALAQGDPGRPYPTFALAMALFPDPAWDAVFPTRPLRFWRLVEISQPAGVPLTVGALRADERITGYVLGLEGLDDRLAALLEHITGDEADLAPSQTCLAAAVARVLDCENPPVVQLLGRDVACKRLVAAHACCAVGRELYALPADRLPMDSVQAETLARLWGRESRLRPLALYLEAGESAGEAERLAAHLLVSDGGALFVGAREPLVLAGPVASFDVTKPSSAEQCAAWQSALGEYGGDLPARLAGQFDLDLAAIRRLAAQSGLTAQAGGGEDRVWETCRLAVRPRLDGVALRLDARATWDDLVLPQAETDLLHQVADQVGQRSKVYDEWGFGRKMNRGLGVTVLFAGESGTGKTMAAEVLAQHLHLDLYRVDLSAVVSKYIGETEKNLRHLFDAAEDGGVILFFDEADALFGKRSEVKDSHDRYANIEVNYLLQRMESYRGLAILATNMKSALDPAFLRRLRFVVSFLFPGPAERRRMWQKAFPTETPTDGLDFDRLARLNLTGGNIHTVALNAAFLAAQGQTPVHMGSVLSAARVEMTKLERPVNEADFFWPIGSL